MVMKGFNINFGVNTSMENDKTKDLKDLAEAIYESEAPTILVVSDTKKPLICVDALVKLLGCRGQIDYLKPNDKVRDSSSLIGFVVSVLHDDAATAALALPGCVILSIEMLTTTPQTGVKSTVLHLRNIEREQYRITYENSIQYKDFVVRFYTATNSEKMCNLKADSMSKVLQALADKMWQKDTDGRAEIRLPSDFGVPPLWFKPNAI